MFKKKIKTIFILLTAIFFIVNLAYTQEYQIKDKEKYKDSYYQDILDFNFNTSELVPRELLKYSKELEAKITNQINDPNVAVRNYTLNLLCSVIHDLEVLSLPEHLKSYLIETMDVQFRDGSTTSIELNSFIFSLRSDLVFIDSNPEYSLNYALKAIEMAKPYIHKDRFITEEDDVYLSNYLNAWYIGLVYTLLQVYEIKPTNEVKEIFNTNAKSLLGYIEANKDYEYITPLMATMYNNIKNGGLDIDYEKLVIYNFPY